MAPGQANGSRPDLATICDHLPFLLAYLDRQLRYCYVNRRYEQLYHRPVAQIEGRFAGDLLGPTFHDLQPHLKAALAGEQRSVDASLGIPPDNRTMSVTYFPDRDETGAVCGLIVYAHDVTETRRTRSSLRDREARLRAMYSAQLEYIGLLSPDGILLECNRAALALAGSEYRSVLGKHLAEGPWWAHTPGAPEIIRDWLLRAAEGETVRGQVPLTRSNGEVLLFDFSVTPVRDERGRVIYLVPEGRDITQYKRTEAALLQSEKLAAVGRLAASIAHEINNPLEAVTNLIFLARECATDPGVLQYLESADQELRRVSLIANQTLRLHRQNAKPQPIVPASLFGAVLSIYRGRLHHTSVRVLERFRASEPVLCFDTDVRQVLNNLVGNAIEAMPQGGTLYLRSRDAVDPATGAPGVLLTVADTGCGMSSSTRRQIFEPFFTTKGNMGNGLGLWVSSEIAKRHGGVLRVRTSQSARHHGTVFALFLPHDPEATPPLQPS